MATRTPVYIDSNDNIKQMTSGEITEWVNQAVYQYSQNPSVTLSYVSSSGNLSGLPLADTRLQAGAQSTSTTAFPNEATTAEPSVVTVNYSRISQTIASLSAPADTGNKAFPLYINASNNLQAMTGTDFVDTFIEPALVLLAVAASDSGAGGTGGTYDIFDSTSTNQGGVATTLIDSNPIFIDTRADTGAYAAGDIPETQDQPTTITSQYLHRINGTDNTPARTPLFFNGANNEVKQYTAAAIESLLEDYIRYQATQQLSYNFDGTGTTRASFVDTRLNGSGNYQTRFVGADDYRAQEFPDGTATTISTYEFKINKT